MINFSKFLKASICALTSLGLTFSTSLSNNICKASVKERKQAALKKQEERLKCTKRFFEDKGLNDVFDVSPEEQELINSLNNFSLKAKIDNKTTYGKIVNVQVGCLNHICHGRITETDGIITCISGAHLFKYSTLINENTYKLSEISKGQLSKKCFFKKGIGVRDIYNMIIRTFKIADFKKSEDPEDLKKAGDNEEVFFAYVKTNSTISTDNQSMLCACLKYNTKTKKYVCCSFYPCLEVPKWYGSVSKTINVN